MLKRLAITTLIGLMFCSVNAFGAEIRALPNQIDGLTTIYLRGPLVNGDEARFRSIVSKTNPKRLVVNSTGGVMDVGLAIADIVHRNRIEVLVLQRNHCESACFMIFAAAPKRDVFDSSVISVHRAAFLVRNRCVDAPKPTREMVAVLSRYGVPQPILRKLQSTPQPGIATLSLPDLRSMGAVVEPEQFFVVGL